MCAIAGEISFGRNVENDMKIFENMKGVMTHRGPDDSNIVTKSHAALIHTRLSVIDPENGAQPMSAIENEKEYIIVYNGELYNTNEIRNELKSYGFKFNTKCDTEVILKSYIKWKDKCVDKFNGIFAFAVWDEKEQKLFIARDRIGVKPFFFSIIGDELIFASEIKAILASRRISPTIDIQSIAEIMLVGPGRTQGYGVFKGIRELPPACCGYFDKNGLATWKYWSLVDKEHEDNLSQTIEKVRFLVTDAIERQLVADVPVCTFLSGGLDSSIISSVADRYFSKKGEKLHTFSVDYVDNDKYFQKSKFQPNSDNEYISIMNEYLNAENHKVILSPKEVADALYTAVEARDLPGMADVDSSMLLLCGQIKKQGTVALSGECADEIFGGYPWYRDETLRAVDGFPWAQSTAYRYSFLKEEFAQKIDAREYVYSKYKKTVSDTSKLDGTSPLESRMKEMMRLNLDWFMQTLLDRKDRMSMYNSLEVRVPFCDYRIAEYLYNVPWEYKEYNNFEKGLLRKAMEGYLPEKVLWRKKSPYPKTHNPEYLKIVSNLLRNIIDNDQSPVLQFVSRDALERLLQTNNAQPWYGQLMTTPQTIAYFVQINYWMEKYNIEIDI